jgi:hypothetical protein
MTKEEFVIQYVLNRARSKTGDLSGEGVVKEALIAWKEIEKICY